MINVCSFILNSTLKITTLSKQTTVYDKIGRAIRSCQFDVAQSSDQRCIETEHDIFGNIVKKEEAVYDQNDLKRNDVQGEIREITYDLRNRPLTVTVDGLPTEQYFYHNETCDTYCGYDEIANKYGTTNTLKTYKDRWGRAAKSVDPFGNETETTYESSFSDNIVSQTTTSSGTKTAETVWTYDDLDRKLTETRKQFIPGSESTTNVNHVTYWDYDDIGNVISVESSDGTKQSYFYDTLNRPVETVNYEKINSNWVETSSSENFYDTNGRLSSTETTRNSQTITEDYGFDTFGRVTSVKTTDSSTQNPQTRYRVKFYNTGGQVIWEADEESDADPRDFEDLGLWHVEVGNEKYYSYNAFGDLEKTVYVMTNNGKGLGSIDLNPWLNNSQITTNFTYDIFGRITSRTNDRSGVTEYSYYQNNTAGSHRRNKLQSIQIIPALTDNDLNYTDSDSSTQTYTYTYDELGDEASVEYMEGNSYSMEVAFTRDDYGRIISKTSNGSVPVTQTFTYNMRNLLETATDTVGNAAATSVTRLYDSFGNPYSETVSSGNVTKTVSRRMTDAKTYQFTYPDGKTLRKTATGNDLDSIEYNNSEIASYSRADGVLTAVTKGQNLIETFSYNNWNMLDNHTVNNANADVYDMSYNYSRGWHLIEKADGIKNTSDKYTYDSYYRLKEVKYDFVNNTAARTDNFYQDGVHNIEQSTENGTTFAWGVDKLNRLRDKKVGNNTAVEYEYDERNNMISEDRSGTTNDRTYIYDDLNRLIEVKDSSDNTIATYTYDAFNRRITKTVGTTTERYTYDDWNIVEISTNSNNYTNIIDSGTDNHIIMDTVSCSDDGNGNCSPNESTLQRIWFHKDERGNIIAISDGNGTIYERYRYRVYGEHEVLNADFTPKTTAAVSPFLWGGSLYEPETNLYWMRNRYYHIDMHRFINQDPIGIWGDANNLGNGFAYVAGMVVEASDPSGLVKDKAGFDVRDSKILKFGPTGSIRSEIEDILDIIDLAFMEVLGSEYEAVATAIQEDRNNKRSKHRDGYAIDLSSHPFKISGNKIVLDIERMDKVTWAKTLNLINKMIIQKYPQRKYSVVHENHFGFGPGTQRKNSDGYTDYDRTGSQIRPHGHIQFNGPYKNPNNKEEKKIDDKENPTVTVELEESSKEATNNTQSSPENNKDSTKKTDANPYDADIILEYCFGCSFSNYPSDPDKDPYNAIQKVLMNNILAKMLKRGEREQPPVFIDNNTGPNGAIMIYRNPYYVNKDPLKTIFFDGNDGSGRSMIYRNPFAAPSEYNPFVSTADFWINSNFNPGNIDPYWQ